MTTDELNAIRYLTIDLAKETFKQDYGSYDEEDDDYIREKSALDSYCEGVEDVLKILGDMKQEAKWIPVTERLPEESTLVLLSCDDMYLARLNPCIGWISENNYWFTFSSRGSYLVKYPIAWMPLPQPYEAESDG